MVFEKDLKRNKIIFENNMPKKYSLILSFIVFGMVLQVSSETISPLVQWKVENGGNNHLYGLIDDTLLTWHEASKVANNNIQDGHIGHLATITSQEENNFIYSMIDNIYNPSWNQWWLGGLLQDSSWTWVTGENWTYSNWYNYSPSGDADPANTIYSRNPWGGLWNDTAYWGKAWSIIEWDTNDSFPSIPGTPPPH